MNKNSCEHHFLANDGSILKNAKKARLVLWITAVTMAIEIYSGLLTGSMALLADGWHMATHAAALGITYLTYRLATSPRMTKNFNFGGGKFLPLGGFTSSLILISAVGLIGYESIERFFNPRTIQTNEALSVAALGLIVNLICAFILRDSHDHHHHHGAHDHNHEHDHHDHEHEHEDNHHHHHDQNIRGAYLHVIADALTSVGAIVALLANKYYGFYFLDPLIGLIGALIILKWALGLAKESGWELLDGHARGVDYNKLKSRLETDGVEIIDLHVWKIAPKALACELVVNAKSPKGIAHYRKIIEKEFSIQHSVIEEHSH